ncbi:MAG: hypothetical protein Q9212_006034, partial [Teloschistes hypoglaucus]
MYLSPQLIALVAATLFSSSSLASPLQSQQTPPVKCNDPKTGVDPKCWTTLKVANYMESWKAKNVPKSCKQGEAWSVCFDRLATSNVKQDCTTINSTTCKEFDPKFRYLSPQWYYGAYNTWSMNHFLTSWSLAIHKLAVGSPSTLATLATPTDIDAFTSAHNPGQKTNIDVALKNLIIQAPKNDQNAALAALLPNHKSTIEYDGQNIEAGELEKGLRE